MTITINGNGTVTGVSVGGLPDGIVDEDMLAADAVTASKIGAKSFVSCALLIDQKSQDTAAGTFTSGAHRVRDLNTEVFDPDNIVTLSSNEFTLASAGSYVIQWYAPCYKADNNVSRLREVTDGTIRDGTNAFAHSGTSIQTHSEGMARVTQKGATTYRIEHRCTNTQSSNGFGVASAAVANYDTFTMVKIWKEA